MRFGLIFFPSKRHRDETPPLEEADRRFFLEFLIVVVIVCGLLALYLRELMVGIEKAKLVEAFSLAQAPRVEAIVHHAVTGTWLHSGSATKDSGNYARDVRFADGAVLIAMQYSRSNAHNQVLSFVPATSAGVPAAVMWLCGEAEPPPGMIRKAHSTTTMPGYLLPSTCHFRRLADE